MGNCTINFFNTFQSIFYFLHKCLRTGVVICDIVLFVSFFLFIYSLAESFASFFLYFFIQQIIKMENVDNNVLIC